MTGHNNDRLGTANTGARRRPIDSVRWPGVACGQPHAARRDGASDETQDKNMHHSPLLSRLAK